MIFGKLIVITLFAIVAIVIFTLILGTWIISRAARTATRVIGGMVGVPQPRFSRYVPVSAPATLRSRSRVAMRRTSRGLDSAADAAWS